MDTHISIFMIKERGLERMTLAASIHMDPVQMLKNFSPGEAKLWRISKYNSIRNFVEYILHFASWFFVGSVQHGICGAEYSGFTDSQRQLETTSHFLKRKRSWTSLAVEGVVTSFRRSPLHDLYKDWMHSYSSQCVVMYVDAVALSSVFVVIHSHTFGSLMAGSLKESNFLRNGKSGGSANGSADGLSLGTSRRSIKPKVRFRQFSYFYILLVMNESDTPS